MLHDRFLRRALGRAVLGAALGALVPGHRRGARGCPGEGGAAIERPVAGAPVSYTHLTLPTICSV